MDIPPYVWQQARACWQATLSAGRQTAALAAAAQHAALPAWRTAALAAPLAWPAGTALCSLWFAHGALAQKRIVPHGLAAYAAAVTAGVMLGDALKAHSSTARLGSSLEALACHAYLHLDMGAARLVLSTAPSAFAAVRFAGAVSSRVLRALFRGTSAISRGARMLLYDLWMAVVYRPARATAKLLDGCAREALRRPVPGLAGALGLAGLLLLRVAGARGAQTKALAAAAAGAAAMAGSFAACLKALGGSALKCAACLDPGLAPRALAAAGGLLANTTALWALKCGWLRPERLAAAAAQACGRGVDALLAWHRARTLEAAVYYTHALLYSLLLELDDVPRLRAGGDAGRAAAVLYVSFVARATGKACLAAMTYFLILHINMDHRLSTACGLASIAGTAYLGHCFLASLDHIDEGQGGTELAAAMLALQQQVAATAAPSAAVVDPAALAGHLLAQLPPARVYAESGVCAICFGSMDLAAAVARSRQRQGGPGAPAAPTQAPLVPGIVPGGDSAAVGHTAQEGTQNGHDGDDSVEGHEERPAAALPCLALRCGHVFHEQCVVAWLQHRAHNPRCPTCRRRAWAAAPGSNVAPG